MTSNFNKKPNLANILAKGLGLLWLIDGLLQLQPKMFGPDFINNVLAPNLSNQPAFLHSLIMAGIRLFTVHPTTANWVAAILQICIGVLLLLPGNDKKFKLGLYLSIAWGLVVWVFGEGAGNLLTGTAGFYSGAPGAAFVYALITIFLLMPEKITSRFLAKTAAVILLLGAALQLQPMFWASGGSSMALQMSAADPVRAISTLPAMLSGSVSAHPFGLNWFLIIILLLLSSALLIKPNRVTASITIIFLFLVWWLGQDFGGLSTVWIGTATDPNTAPLLMLLVLPMFTGWKSYQNKTLIETTNNQFMDNDKKDRIKNRLIGLLLVIIIALAVTILEPKFDTQSTGGQAPPPIAGMPGMVMQVKTFDIQPGQPVPTVSFDLKKDALDGWDLHILTTNFTFTPQDINTAPVLGHGHVHLYIDGQLIVVFGPWYQIETLSPGQHTVRVVLANNDHSIYAINGKYIDQTQTVDVK